MIDVIDQKNAGRFLFGKEKKALGSPALKKILNQFHKQDLAQLLVQLIEGKSHPNLKKAEIIQTIIDRNKKVPIREFLNQYKEEKILSLHPTELESILECSKAERLRWTNENKLIVVGLEQFQYGTYPRFDWLETIRLSYSDKLVRWREEYEEQKKQSRQKAARKACKTRLKNIEQEKSGFDFNSAKTCWQIIAPELAPYLELAYWTLVARRKARLLKEKSLTAKKHGDKYFDQAQGLLDLFRSSFQILVSAPKVQLLYNLTKVPELIAWEGTTWKAQTTIGKNLSGFFSLQLSNDKIQESFWFMVAKSNGKNIFPLVNRLPSVMMLPPKVDKEELLIGNESIEIKLPSYKVIANNLQTALNKFDSDIIEAQKQEIFQASAAKAKSQYADLIQGWSTRVNSTKRRFEQELSSARSRWQTIAPELAPSINSNFSKTPQLTFNFKQLFNLSQERF